MEEVFMLPVLVAIFGAVLMLTEKISTEAHRYVLKRQIKKGRKK